MGRIAALATCALNQCSLDYEGNMDRILESIRRTKAAGASYLCTTELSITGYSCGNHFLERDTEMHSWEVLAKILESDDCSNIIVEVGQPVMHKNIIYNCKVIILNRKVLLIRPKMILANNGCVGSQETRWFTAWAKVREVEEFLLPPSIRRVTGQTTVPFGDCILATKDTVIGFEICEELWNPESCHIAQCLAGAEIISNGLGSREVYGDPGHVYQMVQIATLKNGGCYLLANQRGCDGSTGYYPGDSCIGLNGSIVAHTSLHSLEEVEVTIAFINLESIRRYRANRLSRRCHHVENTQSYPRIAVDFCLSKDDWKDTGTPTNCHGIPILPSKEEQILRAPVCWLWDFLRRSGHRGVLLPLSGNLETSATAAIVFSMCHLVVNAVAGGNEKVLADVRDITGIRNYIPRDADELCGLLVHSFHVETSSPVSHNIAEIISELSKQTGSRLVKLHVGRALAILEGELSACVKNSFKQKGENHSQTVVARQRLQARLTEAAASFLAKSMMKSRNPCQDLVVLGSSTLDNRLRIRNSRNAEHFGTLNLIGCFPEEDIVKFLRLAKDRLNLPVLKKVLVSTEAQAADSMSIVAKEVSLLSNLQTIEGCGPYSMFGRAWYLWKDRATSQKEVAEKVKTFFSEYNTHQQETTLITPITFYMLGNGPPDYARPLFYPQAWSWQFKAIDRDVCL